MFEINSLTQDLTYCITGTSSLYYSCILKNEASGMILGNTLSHPSFLLVYSPYQESFQLMGKALPKNEWDDFRKWFTTTLIPFIHDHKLGCFEFGCDHQELSDMIYAIFADYELLSDPQKLFRWSTNSPMPLCPDEYEIERVDDTFLAQNYENLNYITTELEKAYGDITNYSKYGVAYVALYKNRIVARADMLFSHKGYGNISVDTEEAHRQKGLSTLLTLKTIE